jgi:hypothetical protein
MLRIKPVYPESKYIRPVQFSKKLICFLICNCILFEKLVFNIIQDTALIRKRSHDGVSFIEFDRNPNFVPGYILPDFVERSKNHENCNPYRMNLYKVLFIS